MQLLAQNKDNDYSQCNYLHRTEQMCKLNVVKITVFFFIIDSFKENYTL